MESNTPHALITAERLDHLVEGTLPDLERRALLLSLDGEPGGWRRCALAFLEAQSWRRSIGSITEPTPVSEPSGNPPVLRHHRSRIVWGTLAAAIAFLAFLAGRSTGPIPRSAPVPRRIPPSLTMTQSEPVSKDVNSSGTEQERLATANHGEQPDPRVLPKSSLPYQAIGVLNLADDDDPDAPLVQLPILAGPGIDDGWLREQPPFVPEEVRRSWERSGFDVEFQRRLVSVQLDEAGRYLTIPVDEVMLRQPTRSTY